MPQVPQDYVPVFLQIVLGLGFAVFTLAASVLIGKRGRRTAAKDQPYECGKDPIGPTHSRFSIKFYLVAMLFILFDIEVVFMYTWAVVYRDMLHQPDPFHPGHMVLNLGIFYSMFSFIGILFVGFLYALKKKAFDWTHNPGSSVPPVPLLDANQPPVAAKLH
ncbi:MAG TPA: NADH-quinone oxidoreductase subunit A [Candidatus Methylacidiphilales bacterium]|jgi:NADH-quinone oxidoreductase subunit A|nr:NADH-quinone oxidoreductase subunit A [Candidatus Methylacidiphilales bacterium]